MKNVIQVTRWRESIKGKVSPLLICVLLLVPGVLFLGVALGTSSHSQEYSVVVAGSLAMVIIVLVRLDELAVALILAIHIYIDWFLGLHLIGILMALMLLFVYYFARSAEHPWVEPRLLWLWALFLVLTIYPAIYGGQLRLYDLATFCPSMILGAFLMFWLGTLIVRDRTRLRRLCEFLALLGALLAIHTIIQATTGIFLFGSQRVNDLLSQVGNYQLTNSNATRAVSFLIDPNWNGSLLAMMAFLPLGLFFEGSSLLGKALYLFETVIILTALVFTYSNSGWVGAIAGIIIFMLFVGSKRSGLLVLSYILLSAVILIVFFPNEISIQLQHASNPQEVIQRVGAWQTALQTIRAFPLTGIGLGYLAYQLRTQPFSAFEQGIFSQPHDSYLEWATMAGIPVLLVYVALVLFALWMALRTWVRADVRTRSLIGCGMAAIVSLSMSSITIDGWTHPVMAEVGWLILGAITSPLLIKSLDAQQSKEKVML